MPLFIIIIIILFVQ